MKAKIKIGEHEYLGILYYREIYHPMWNFHSSCGRVVLKGGFHLTKTRALEDAKSHGITILEE